MPVLSLPCAKKISVKIMGVFRMDFLMISFVNVRLKYCWLIGSIPSPQQKSRDIQYFHKANAAGIKRLQGIFILEDKLQVLMLVYKKMTK